VNCQVYISRGSEFGHEICTLIALSKSMMKSEISRAHDVFDVLNENRINVVLRDIILDEIDSE
jgi:hypothetical protein